MDEQQEAWYRDMIFEATHMTSCWSRVGKIIVVDPPIKRIRVIDEGYLAHQRWWSNLTFGPGNRTKGVIDHIRKELLEIEESPWDVDEWADVIILAFDGAWRAGWEPQEIIDAVIAKQAKNETRKWPDWRTMTEEVAIEHIGD